MDWNHLADLIRALAWPVTVLVILGVFRRELRAIASRMEGAKLPGGTELSFGKAGVDRPVESGPKAIPSRAIPIDSSKVGNLYWLGHDLMWTMDVLLRQAPGASIQHGLRQSLHHSRSLGLDASEAGRSLGRLGQDADRMSEADWTSASRDRFASEIKFIADSVGTAVSALQDGYEARAGVVADR